MVSFETIIKKFGNQGEKTGWSYILIPEELALKLKPVRTSFRVKGKLDDHFIKGIALIPMGDGDFIIPLKAELRKILRKNKGDNIKVSISVDNEEKKISKDLLECLSDDPDANKNFNKLSNSHKNYYSNWIEAAKTEVTRAKRIACAVNALSKGFHYGQMMQFLKKNKGII